MGKKKILKFQANHRSALKPPPREKRLAFAGKPP